MKPPPIADMLKDLAFSMRQMAEEAGTDCDAPGCNALTLGTRCQNCSRRLCTAHAYWNLSGGKPSTFCPYCIVAQNKALFSDDDDDDDDGADGVVDAEFERY